MENQSPELQCLPRIETLLTALVRSSLTDAIAVITNDKRLSRLLELTGKATVREAPRKTGTALGTISKAWREWEKLGLIVKDGSQYKRIV
jgi:predicted transcriptional regulator